MMVSERKNDLIRFTGFNEMEMEMEGNTVMVRNNRSEKSKLNYTKTTTTTNELNKDMIASLSCLACVVL